MEPDRRVVLIGAGHAHLHVASRAAEFRRHGAELTLIDPDAFWYSGLATGMLGGLYDRELDRVDPEPLLRRAGGRFIRERVVDIDRSNCVVSLQTGDRLTYDLLSLNVGSEVALGALTPLPEGAWPAKPIRGLWELRARLEERFRADPDDPVRVIVIGGGPTGCEIAANVDALARVWGARVRVTLVSDQDRLLADRRRRVSRRVARCLTGRGVEVLTRTEITEIDEGAVLVRGGGSIPWDLAVVATGLRAPEPLAELGLEVGPDGGLLVDQTLRSVDDSKLFGAGDCVYILGHPLPMLGVYAVREAPILANNLLAALGGDSLQEYRPQKRCLTILNLGLGNGLALWGPFHWLGPLSMWLKDRIDRRFLAKYRVEDDAGATG